MNIIGALAINAGASYTFGLDDLVSITGDLVLKSGWTLDLDGATFDGVAPVNDADPLAKMVLFRYTGSSTFNDPAAINGINDPGGFLSVFDDGNGSVWLEDILPPTLYWKDTVNG